MPSSLAPWSAQRWHALFCAHQPQLLAYLTGKTGSRDEAHDLVQETWLRLAAAPAQLPDGSSPSQEAARAYLFATAKHLALDHLRQRGVQQRSLQDWEQLQPPSASDVADQAMYRQALNLVAQVIAELPARMQSALLAHRLHGQTHAQIAQTLQVSLNTVERDLMQADACLEAALLRWRGDAQGTQQAAARRRRRGALGALLGVTGLACAGWPAWQLWQQRLLWQGSLASGTGMQRSLDLPDGSQLRIDAASHVELRYRAGLREAQLLAGAAFFSVARDTSRPFVVQAGTVRISVLGTRFGVELEPDSVLVQVESGQVRVEQLGSQQQILLQGQQSLQVPLAESAAAWQVQTQPRPAAWREGELVFDQQPLGQVIERLGRYSTRKLQIDEGAAQLPISGHVRIVQAERWLRSLPQLAPVQVKAQADGGLQISRRKG
ncbi:sigma-70 family RNA polymerase sigma factor [Comamonas sp. JUb58]|uniref:sigma-70 family RNA polymerase sigma factor n=1 Tax=Comamonas sp. JUb58 TaxID=2485114 RepID=UPI00105BD6D8|nr:sigma-70 family RNA polymerase sigma factor [Comamonas sp. JUb58]TDS76695.1 FecR family protein [Comamonas sp. JUb58]